MNLILQACVNHNSAFYLWRICSAVLTAVVISWSHFMIRSFTNKFSYILLKTWYRSETFWLGCNHAVSEAQVICLLFRTSCYSQLVALKYSNCYVVWMVYNTTKTIWSSLCICIQLLCKDAVHLTVIFRQGFIQLNRLANVVIVHDK